MKNKKRKQGGQSGHPKHRRQPFPTETIVQIVRLRSTASAVSLTAADSVGVAADIAAEKALSLYGASRSTLPNA